MLLLVVIGLAIVFLGLILWAFRRQASDDVSLTRGLGTKQPSRIEDRGQGCGCGFPPNRDAGYVWASYVPLVRLETGFSPFDYSRCQFLDREESIVKVARRKRATQRFVAQRRRRRQKFVFPLKDPYQ